MRFTVVLVVLCAILIVSMANRANKAKRLRRKMMKNKEMKGDHCSHIVTWSACVDEKMTQTVSMNMSDPACSHPIVDSQTKTNTMDCVTVTTKTLKKGCTKTVTRDFRGCENDGTNYTLTAQKSAECGRRKGNGAMEKTFEVPCNRPVGMDRAAKKMKNKNKKAKKGNRFALKKQFFKERREMESKGCAYNPEPCDKSTNMKVWKVTSGDSTVCNELTSPCFLGKMKKNKGRRTRGGKRQA